MRFVVALVTALVLLVLTSESGLAQAGRYNCEDFHSVAEAQAFFEQNGGPQYDPYYLDGDGDGRVCEWGVNRTYEGEFEESRPSSSRADTYSPADAYSYDDYIDDMRSEWESAPCEENSNNCPRLLSDNSKDILSSVLVLGFIGMTVLGAIGALVRGIVITLKGE